MKKIIALFLSIVLLFSCADKLNEEIVGTATFDYYNTEPGIEALVNGAYNSLRWQFNGEQSFTLWEYGVDEYMQAADGQNKFVDMYSNQLNATFSMFHDMWAEYYKAINACNIGLKLIPTVKSEGGVLSTQAGRDTRMAELRFLRGYYYFMLVQQFGAIPITTEPSEGVRLEFPRQPVADVYNLIINDMRAADAVLPPTQANRGRITNWASKHFLAKVYLTRGSAIQEARGQQPTDMDSAAYYADLVITTGPHTLPSNYADLWNITNEANSEIILSAQFNNNALLLANSGNRLHLYFQMVYDTKPGMERDITYGRPFRRMRPTQYTINVFDRKNDSRFYKSLRTAYLSNDRSAPFTIPKWTQADADKGFTTAANVGKDKFAVGDTAIFVTMDVFPTCVEGVDPGCTKAQRDALDKAMNDAIAKQRYSWFPQNKWTNTEFPTLVKWMDPTRLDVGIETAGRDGILARLGETYLISAEAHGRKSTPDYATATARINTLRQRAAYKAGEAKPTSFWKTEGGMYGDMSSTESALLLPVDGSYWDNAPALEQYPASAGSKASRFLHFMLNERTRELLGELHRWNDLVRTETFVERVRAFHPLASPNVQPYHKLRPIPQAHLERVFEGGKPLNAEQRAAVQNAGY